MKTGNEVKKQIKVQDYIEAHIIPDDVSPAFFLREVNAWDETATREAFYDIKILDLCKRDAIESEKCYGVYKSYRVETEKIKRLELDIYFKDKMIESLMSQIKEITEQLEEIEKNLREGV